MTGTVNVGCERAPVRGKFADGSQGENLKAAAVGQNRAVPMLELVQSAGLAEYLQTGTEVQMIGISKYDFRTDIFLQFLVIHTLDGAYGTHGHKYRGLYIPVVRGYESASRAGCLVGGGKCEFHL